METVAVLRNYAQKLRDTEQTAPERWLECQHAFAAFYDFTLFTVLCYDAKSSLLVRLFSNNETINPLGGKKRAITSKWSETVLLKGEVLIAPDKAALMDIFPDAPYLISHGCECVLNIPVKYQDRVIGTINMLHKEHSYDDADLSPALILSQMLVPYLIEEGLEANMTDLPGQITANI